MNISDPTTVVEFDAALRSLAARAATRYPGETDRLGRGLVLALNGHVTLLPDSQADVQSGSNPEIVYHITHGQCDCQDASRAPDGRCKHLFAAVLVRRATCGMTPLEKALEPEAVAPSTQPPEGQELPPLAPHPRATAKPELPATEELEPEAAAESVELPVDDELPPLVPTTAQYEPAPAVVEDDTLVPFLPEAGASLNIKVKAGQFEVMYTLRAHDDASVLARLPVVVETLERMLPAGEEEGLLLRLLHAFFPPSARMR